MLKFYPHQPLPCPGPPHHLRFVHLLIVVRSNRAARLPSRQRSGEPSPAEPLAAGAGPPARKQSAAKRQSAKPEQLMPVSVTSFAQRVVVLSPPKACC